MPMFMNIYRNKIYLENLEPKRFLKNKDEISKELNDSNTVVFINSIKYDYNKCFKPEGKGIFNVRLKLKIDLED